MKVKQKHNKIKNTGILFELLCKQVVTEALAEDKPQVALSIIKKSFKKGSELLNELVLYQTIFESFSNKRHSINEVIDATVKTRNKIDRNKLQEQKFNLIRLIKKNYDLNEFFNMRIGNYKLSASVYNLFEFDNSNDIKPQLYLDSKKYLIEQYNAPVVETVETELLKESPEVIKLTFKKLVEAFNDKYSTLLEPQRLLLNRFLNEGSINNDFKDFVILEAHNLRKSLLKLSKNQDPVRKIKLHECASLLDNITSSDTMKDEYVTTLLNYYELVEELRNE